MKEKCETCLYYNPLSKETGVCTNANSVIGIAYNYQFCHLHKGNGHSKVTPRRLCDFCERGKRMESEEGEHDLRLVKLTPLPAINLTTGEIAETADPPYSAMFLYESGRESEAATFPIKFCPACGRKLVWKRATKDIPRLEAAFQRAFTRLTRQTLSLRRYAI